MKEEYSRPTIVNADSSEPDGLAPWGVVAKAFAMAGGYLLGRAVTNAAKANPYIKLPSLKILKENTNDIHLA